MIRVPVTALAIYTIFHFSEFYVSSDGTSSALKGLFLLCYRKTKLRPRKVCIGSLAVDVDHSCKRDISLYALALLCLLLLSASCVYANI